MKNLFLSLLVLSVAFPAQAQFSVGVKGGFSRTTITRSNADRIDETYSALCGYEIGVQTRYHISDWMAIRTDLSLMQRAHRMDRHLNYLDSVFTEYHNLYLTLPVLADFSYGGERFRGHTFVGGFIGYWLQSHIVGKTYWMTDYYIYFNDFDEKRAFTNDDKRFCAGATCGLGVSYALNERWYLTLDALYYYDLTSHHSSYTHLGDPRYLNTLSLTMGSIYKF